MKGRMRLLSAVGAVAAAAALMVPGTAFAAGPGGGRGGGGTGGETTASNNLSVPAIFVGGNPFSLDVTGAAKDPAGVPATSDGTWTVSGYYYVQGTHLWQASATQAAAATATADWGDNLTGTAALKVGSPIRVEVGLLAADPATLGMTGYAVYKLDENALDRVSPYGTPASGPQENAAPAEKVSPYPEVRVWAAGSTLKIFNAKTGAEVYNGAASAEISATGRVVYGYNLRVPSAGDYTIEFTAGPGVTLSNADEGTSNTVSINITVGGGGARGGGAGGGGGPRS